jgi:hypothetical protein
MPLDAAGRTGLTPGTIYYYRALSGLTGQGSRATGDTLSVLTKAPTPTITGTTSSGTAITISFTFTSPGPNVILEFTAECTPVGGGATVSQKGFTSPITVAGLLEGTEYTCEVIGESSSSEAQHGGGFGSRSDARTQTIPAANPPTGGGDNNSNPITPIEPTPRRDVTGTTVRTRGNNSRTEPVPGLLQNDPTRLPPAAHNITANRANLEIRGGNVIVTPLNGWTGRMFVPVITNIDGEDVEVTIEVIVEPELPERGQTTLNRDATTEISWERSSSQVVR